MEPIGILYATPVWVTLLVTAAMAFLALEAGLHMGRRRKDPGPEQGPVDTLTGSTLALLAFLLAFAFAIAAARFETRTNLIVTEAQVTREAFLEASLLPSPQREHARGLLREYVEVRIQGVRHRERRQAAILRSDAIHRALWEDIRRLSEVDPASTALSNYRPAVIALIAAHQERLAKAPDRIPAFVWWALYFLTAATMVSLGYQLGLARSRRPIVATVWILALSTVFTMIVDLDRAQQGLLVVSQRPLEDLLVHMQQETP